MRPYYIILLLGVLLGNQRLMAQSDRIDSLENILKTSASEMAKVKALNILSYEYLFTDTVKANNCVKQLFEMSQTTMDSAVKAAAYKSLADQYTDLEDYTLALSYYNTAIELYKNLNTKESRIAYAKTLVNKGIIPHIHGDFNEALILYSEAEPILMKEGEKRYLINLYNKKCDVYEQMNLKEKALEYALKAVQLSEQEGDAENMARSYLTFIANATDVKQKMEYLKKAKQLIEKAKLPDWHLFYYYLNYGGELYKQKLFVEALNSYLMADKYAFDEREKLTNRLSITQIYIDLKQYEKAEKELLQAYEEANKQELKLQIRDILLQMIVCDSVKGDFKKAFVHLKKSVQLNNEILSNETQKRFDFLNAKYDVTRREAEIQKLKDDKKLQQLQIHQKNILNVVFGVGILFFFITSILIYRNQKQRRNIAEQKVKTLESEKQLIATRAVLKGETDERMRIARDLHDGLGGLLSGTKLILNNMKENVILSPTSVNDYNNALQLLDSSINELRRVAYNMMPETLFNNGLEKTLGEFCNALNNQASVVVKFSFFGSFKRLDNNLEIVVFRVIQELTNNALKHSKAEAIHVQLIQEDNRISASVQDNGFGFDLSRVDESKSSGLRNIRSRVMSMGGQFHLDTSVGKGTEAIIEFVV